MSWLSKVWDAVGRGIEGCKSGKHQPGASAVGASADPGPPVHAPPAARSEPQPVGAPACHVLILVATESEQAALESVSGELGLAFERKDAAALGEYFDLGVVGGDRVFAVKTRMGAIRHEGSAYKAIMFRATQATAIIQIGMAFGVSPTVQHHGDVLIATSIVPYDERDVFDRAGKRFIDYKRAKRRAAKGALVKLFEREKARGKHKFDVHVGALLSGGARIFSADFRDELVREVPPGKDPIVGGEMEGIGLLSAAPADRPLWGIVKGISDFADAEHDAIIEETRLVACTNAARFVLAALRNNLE